MLFFIHDPWFCINFLSQKHWAVLWWIKPYMKIIFIFLFQAAEKLKEKESGASSQNTWGSWVTGWTSWYGYGELEERGDSEKEKASGGPSVTFNEPISKGMISVNTLVHRSRQVYSLRIFLTAGPWRQNVFYGPWQNFSLYRFRSSQDPPAAGR